MEPTLAGPKRPQDRVLLRESKAAFAKSMSGQTSSQIHVKNNGDQFDLSNGSVVIAAITSCTNTSNPSLMMGAGLLGEKSGGARADGEAVGENEFGAGIESGDGLSGCGGADAISWKN